MVRPVSCTVTSEEVSGLACRGGVDPEQRTGQAPDEAVNYIAAAAALIAARTRG